MSGEGFLEEEIPAEPRSVEGFHVLQIREHTLVIGFKEKMGLSRPGGTYEILSISLPPPSSKLSSLLSWTTAKAFQLFSLLPFLLLYSLFCTQKSE